MSPGIERRLGSDSTPNTAAEVLIVVSGTWEHSGAIQAQTVVTVVIARRRRPIEAV